MKQVRFLGRSRKALRDFPADVRGEAGDQLFQLQKGEQPDDWKPMLSIGRGVEELRISEASGAFRLIYIARFQDAVYVLHCFQKKSQKTSAPDIEVARSRYRELMETLRDGN